ncbi:MAG: hypothetical protein IKF71_03385 [Bacilli bacterium]|nr:hypothetical protein [Bacilli bacterium]
MFERIEKEYKKNSKEVKFTKFYWISAIISTIVFSTAKIDNNIKNYNFITIIILVIAYLLIDYNKTIKKNVKANKNKFIDNFKAYLHILKSGNLNNLITLLKKYNFKTKNDLKLAIDYFNSKRSIKIESSFWGHIISALVSIASILAVAYDPINQKIDYTKISIIYGTSIGYILIAIVPIIIIKLIINNIAFSKEKLHLELSDKLSYIYINFDKYKNQLTKIYKN